MTTEIPQRPLKAAALSLVRDGKIDDAIDKYRQYLTLNPRDEEAWAMLGGAYRRKDAIDEAIESYERAYALNRQSTYALINVVSLRAARNTEQDQAVLQTYLPEAIKLCTQATDEGGDHWTWYDLATLQLIQGETEEAASAFHYAVELTPKDARQVFESVLNNLGFLRGHNPSIKGIENAIEIVEVSSQ
jgi:tetratricopeptide (TPR) repeat protein